MICPRPFLPLTLSFHRVNGLSNGPLAVGTLHHMPIPGPLLPSIISAKMSSTGVSSVIRVARFLSLPDAWGVVRRTNGNRGAQLSSYACSQVNCFGLQLIRSSGSSFACTMKHWEDVSLAAQGASRVFPAPHTGFLCCPEQAAWRPFHGGPLCAAGTLACARRVQGNATDRRLGRHAGNFRGLLHACLPGEPVKGEQPWERSACTQTNGFRPRTICSGGSVFDESTSYVHGAGAGTSHGLAARAASVESCARWCLHVALLV